jgi:hypothetical protein
MANNGAGYLAFGQIAVGIEFFGACRDSKDFATAGESKSRFNKGISHYMAKVDTRYATYNTKKSESIPNMTASCWCWNLFWPILYPRARC